MIGVAITTHNRPEVLAKGLAEQRKYLPDGAILVVVDDASDTPTSGATFTFPHNAGIAAAKNKCIELLMSQGCTHFFLFDDDTWPKAPGWELPYINSGEKHLSFTFPTLANGKHNGRKLLGKRGKISEYGSPCGCMLYFTREVVDKIGGMDVGFVQWGMEHVDFSRRAFLAGLTSRPYLDVSRSGELLYSMDREQEAKGSTPKNIRTQVLAHNRKRMELSTGSRFIPYRHPTDGVLLASYFATAPDGQSGQSWDPDPEDLFPLVESCRRHGVAFKIFHDCLPLDCEEFPRVQGPTYQSPNAHRWGVYLKWLSQQEAPPSNIWMVDSTDVEVLRNPFQALDPDVLYSGDEAERTDNIWMRKRQEPHLATIADYRQVIAANAKRPLLNCGIVGGSLYMAIKYLVHRADIHGNHTRGVSASTDMAVHNYIMHKYFDGHFDHGIKINTKFKAYQSNGVSFFKHK